MTDEIKKAMGCNSPFECLECDLEVCRALHLPEPIVDLIKRQKAEIERLKEKYDRVRCNLQAVLDERADHSEAINRLAEKLKEYYPSIANGIDYTAEEVLKG